MLLKERGRVEDAEKLMQGQLKVLNLGDCQLCDEVLIVAAFLKFDETVDEVWLSGNYIGPFGAKAIADALKYNKKVWLLNLFHNQIEQEGAEALIDALNHNICILELDVNYNSITPESEATIEYLIQTRNKTLIPAAARRASLYLIAARRATPIADAGHFAIFPKEIVRMIAMAVWATRKDPKWIEAVKE